MRRIDVAIAILRRNGKVLICQRRPKERFGSDWEFPGGKRESHETLPQCLARELREELDIQADVVTPLAPIDHDYPDVRVRLHPFLCEHRAGEPKLLECTAAIWVEPADLHNYRFPPANERLIEAVISQLKRGA